MLAMDDGPVSRGYLARKIMKIRHFRSGLLSVTAALAGLSVLGSDADAISRYWSTTMTCAALNATVQREKAVLFRWQSHLTGNTLYGRFVVNDNYCLPSEMVGTLWIPSSDKAKCALNQCVHRDMDDDLLLRRR